VINSIVTVSPTTEFSVEIDPTEVDLDKIKALVKCGMTRTSFGIQDFNPKIQTSIGRKQSFNETKFAIDQVRDHGIRSVNVDLVYGLPFQTQTGFDQTIRKIQELRPDRIALYGYAHVPWMAKRQRMIPESSLPTPHQRLALFESAKIVLLSAGYKQVGIDHFALPEDSMAIASDKGKMRRNFQGYTTDSSEYLIGIGASAISRFPEGYAQNYASTSAYAKVIQQGGLAIERGHKFDTYDKMIGQIIESLMCNFQVDTKDIVSNHPISKGQLHSLFNHVNKQFKFSLKISNKGLSIPESLRPLTRVIARKFDNYELSHRGHSNAI
jgi:oxygen-independent coproporphyrinogen-3 oxidase